MSINGTETSNYSFQKGGGLQVPLGNTITSNTVSPQNLSLGQEVPRIPALVSPQTGSNETFDERASIIESDDETYTFNFPAAGDCVDSHIIIANYQYIVDSVSAKFTTASSSGTLDVKVCDNGEAISSGVSVLDSAMSIAGDANTNVSGVLSSDSSDRKLLKGQSLALDFDGTLTSLAGLAVTVVLRRILEPRRENSYLE